MYKSSLIIILGTTGVLGLYCVLWVYTVHVFQWCRYTLEIFHPCEILFLASTVLHWLHLSSLCSLYFHLSISLSPSLLPHTPALEQAGQHLEDSMSACYCALLLARHEQVGWCARTATVCNVSQHIQFCADFCSNPFVCVITKVGIHVNHSCGPPANNILNCTYCISS